jgi:putative endonuclease
MFEGNIQTFRGVSQKGDVLLDRSDQEIIQISLFKSCLPYEIRFKIMKYYVYVLQSKIDQKFYTGFTKDMANRLDEHNKGKIVSTKNRRPFNLVYYECSLNIDDALHREKYLKTTYGKRYIRNRIKNYLKSLDETIS